MLIKIVRKESYNIFVFTVSGHWLQASKKTRILHTKFQENKGFMDKKWAFSVVMGVMQILWMSVRNYEIIIYFRNVNVYIQGSKGQLNS